MYPLGVITSISGLTINGSSSTYFSIFKEDDVVVLNEVTAYVDTTNQPYDFKFNVKNTLTGVSGDIIYSTSKCVWLRYQIKKIEMAIANYDYSLLGVDEASNGSDKLKFNYQNTPIAQLRSLKADYERQLQECEAAENNKSVWYLPRFEYGV